MTPQTTLILMALACLMPGAATDTRAATVTSQPTAADVQNLQGTWEGVLVGHESAGKITITFAGNTLHFQGLNAKEWYDATFTLVEGTSPRQLRATITGCERAKDIGKVVEAIFKIEEGTLSLAGFEGEAIEPPKDFGNGKLIFEIGDGSVNLCIPNAPGGSDAFSGNSMFHYKFRKAPPQTIRTRQ